MDFLVHVDPVHQFPNFYLAERLRFLWKYLQVSAVHSIFLILGINMVLEIEEKISLIISPSSLVSHLKCQPEEDKYFM